MEDVRRGEPDPRDAEPVGADTPDGEAARPYRKRKGEGHVRREEILAAAKAVFIEDGYENTTIRKIAARAHVSPTALYLYFPDKDRILIEICDSTFTRLIDEMSRIEREERDPLRRLRHMMECYLRFGLKHPDEYRLTFMAKSLGILGVNHKSAVADMDMPGTKGPQGFAKLLGIVADCISAGYLKGDDPELTAELIWAGGHGLVSLLITHPHFPWSDQEALIKGMLDMQLRGMLAEGHR